MPQFPQILLHAASRPDPLCKASALQLLVQPRRGVWSLKIWELTRFQCGLITVLSAKTELVGSETIMFDPQDIFISARDHPEIDLGAYQDFNGE